MKKLFLALTVCLFSISFTFGQTRKASESQDSTQRIYEFYRQGKFDEAISLARIIVNNERTAPDRNLQNLAVAILNLALLEKEHYFILEKDISNSILTKAESAESLKKRIAYQDSIEALLPEVIKIYQNELKIETLQLAEAKFELASFATRFADRQPGIKLDSTGAKIDKRVTIEDLYLQALDSRRKLAGTDSDITILTIMNVSDFYRMTANLEKALVYYQNFIEIVEKKYGRNSQFLLPALRSCAQILLTVERRPEAQITVDKISQITGQKETVPETDLDLTLRNKKDRLEAMMSDTSTITTYLKKQKWLMVNVLINENGKVVEIKAADSPEKNIKGKNVREQAEKEVIKWEFEPFVDQGTPRKMRGIIWYPYFVKA